MRDQIKKHGVTVCIVAAGVVVMRFIAPSPMASIHPMKAVVSVIGSAAPKQHVVDNSIPTRLVSCGDMRGENGAYLYGASELRSATDEHGSIRLGPGADGKCTLLFSVPQHRICSVVGGHVKSINDDEMIIDNASTEVTYSCEGNK